MFILLPWIGIAHNAQIHVLVTIFPLPPTFSKLSYFLYITVFLDLTETYFISIPFQVINKMVIRGKKW